MKKSKLFIVLAVAFCFFLSAFALVGCGGGGGDKSTKGLLYEQIEGTKNYRVKSLGEATDTDIVIAKKYKGGNVVEIADRAFDKEAITSVKIPSTIKRIGDKAFENCTSLVSVDIPDTVTFIGINAFKNCVALKNIALPSNLSRISAETFSGCSSIEQLVLPESIINISNEAFKDCSKLTNVVIPSAVTIINHSAFENCTLLASVSMSEGITKISDYAFKNCKALTEITFPDSLRELGKEVLAGCVSLTKMKVPFIGSHLTLPRNPTRYTFGYFFGEEECEGATATEQLYFDDSSGQTTTMGAVYYIPTGLTEVTVTSADLPYSAFYNCRNLEKIVLGPGVKELGMKAFYVCTAIQTIEMEAVVTIDKFAFACCAEMESITLNEGVLHIGQQAFAECYKLKEITIPDSVKTLGDALFYHCEALERVVFQKIPRALPSGFFAACTALASYEVPEGVEEIGYQAFTDCTSLTTLVIPTSVTKIGYEMFWACENLTTITYKGTMAEWEQIEINEYWNFHCRVEKIVCSDGEIAVESEFLEM